MAGVLDVAHIKVRLYTDGPPPDPSNAYGDFTWAGGTNSKSISAWTPRLEGGVPFLSSSEITFVPGTDMDTGGNVKGFAIVTDDDPPVLVGAEDFPGNIPIPSPLNVIVFIAQVSLDPLGDMGHAVVA